MKLIFLILISIMGLDPLLPYHVKASANENLNATQKKFLINSTIANKLNKEKLDKDFVLRVHRQLKSEKDKKFWLALTNDWDGNKYLKFESFMDEFQVSVNGSFRYQIKFDNDNEKQIVYVNGEKKYVIDPNNIFDSIKSKNQRTAQKSPTLKFWMSSFLSHAKARIFGEFDPDAAGFLYEEKIIFLLGAGARAFGSNSIAIDSPKVVKRDPGIKLNMGNSEIPLDDFLNTVRKNVGPKKVIECSNQFSGSLGGEPFKAELNGNLFNITFGTNASYTINFKPNANLEKREFLDKYYPNELTPLQRGIRCGRIAKNAKSTEEYQSIYQECYEFLMASNEHVVDYKCTGPECDRKIGGPNPREEEIKTLDDEIKKHNSLKAEAVFKNDTSNAFKEINIIRGLRSKKESLMAPFIDFRNRMLKTAFYSRALSRCCEADNQICQKDMLKNEALELNLQSKPPGKPLQ